MLRLKRLVIENFGPYRDTQTFDVATEDGVVIVWGENMRGKTSLLNAIRYAFFGRVISRGERAIALHQIVNQEAAAAGTHRFKVVMQFDHGGRAYELTRLCRKRDHVTTPLADVDYIEEFFLQCDGSVLAPDAATALIATILPEKVARFFLFDGELLQQYEELLRLESAMGQQIKDAIERILGVPVLTNGRADLLEQQRDYQKLEAKAAQRDQKTQQLGLQHVRLLDERNQHEKEIARLSGELESLRTRKVADEEALKRTERTRAMLLERDKLEKEIGEIDKRLGEREARLKEHLADAWRWVLQKRIADIRKALEEQIARVRDVEAKRAVSADLVVKVKAALASGSCGTCQQSLSAPARELLTKMLADLVAGATSNDRSTMQQLMAQAAVLDGVSRGDGSAVVEEIVGSIDDLKMDRAKAITRQTDLADQTRNLDESEIRKQYGQYERTVQEITVIEGGIVQETAALVKSDDDIKRVQEQLDKVGGADVAKERQRRELSGRMAELFAEGVSLFRDDLRKQVEIDATDLFKQLTTEPEYDRLRINDSYGLTIVHKDGQEIPVRSAGAEHIVALSLLGALQRNAPMRGPIIMDSPFGRLDAGHTMRVVRTLPNLAPQAILLVYESELDPQSARQELKGMLRREYKIERRSARYSQLQLVTGSGNGNR